MDSRLQRLAESLGEVVEEDVTDYEDFGVVGSGDDHAAHISAHRAQIAALVKNTVRANIDQLVAKRMLKHQRGVGVFVDQLSRKDHADERRQQIERHIRAHERAAKACKKPVPTKRTSRRLW